ncbi:MAG: pyridoxal phosphate-dependent aminotransferase [Lewinellaceae bacterium]|nr:pyridoxal phosphate-dependent aminotransferase [Lewinellaceae bacterium]
MISKKVSEMEESATIRMAQKSRDLASKGVSVISLSLGEPDFDTPNFIKEAAYDALKHGNTKYTPVPGLMELRKAICQKFLTENNLHFSPSQIVVSNGAKQSIFNICMATINPGDEVILLAPYWVSYIEIVKFAGGVPIVIKSDISTNFKTNADELRSFLTEKTKLLIFSSPCNPTGSVYGIDELNEIAEVLKEFPNVLVVSDEIYEYINFSSSHVSFGAIEGMDDRTATINGFSKGYAMTGWRLGYMGGPQWLADACNKVQGQVTSGAASFSQEAAIHALKNGKEEAEKMCVAFKQRRDLLLSKLHEIPGLKLNRPEGAFYIFMDVSSYFGKSDGKQVINNADDFAEAMLTEAHVGMVSGGAFGDDQCVRLSYAASDEQLKMAAQRIKEALSKFH